VHAAGILDGITVIDFTQVIAGPACTRLMAELGAEVIKIELAPAGDMARGLPEIRNGRSAYFFQHNQGKKSVCIDLRQPDGLDLAKRLIGKADVVIENFSPGTIGRLGLDWDTVHAVNPAAIMCSISAFGQDGPLTHLPGFDYIAQAYSGATSMIGEPDAPPALTGFAVGDVGTAMMALAAINGALFHRQRHGGDGQYLDVSLIDFYFHAHEVNVEATSLNGYPPTRAGSHHPAVAPLGVYRATDGFIMLVVLDPMWPRLCRAMGRPELEHDARFADGASRLANAGALVDEIETWMRALPDRDAALARLHTERVPAAPVLTVEEAMRHPHLLERGIVRDVCDPVIGPFAVTGNPLRFSAVKAEVPERAPFLGEHNRGVLMELLGLEDKELTRLEAAEVLRAEPVPAG